MINLPGYFQHPYFLIFLGIVSALLTAILTPRIKKLARKLGAIDRGGYRRVSRTDVPLLGGMGIAIPIILLYICFGLAGYAIIGNWETVYRFNRNWFSPLMDFAVHRGYFSHNFIILAVGGAAILVLGIIDDLRGMRARVKLLGQFIVAGFVCASGFVLQSFYVPLIGAIDLGPGVGVVISIIWIVGLINAFNLIDGLDGLATGVALIASLALVVLGAMTGNSFIIFSCTALAGSLAAFLVFNFYPASIILGDTGSMFIGYILGTITLMGTYKAETVLIILAPMLALSFPIFETLISMVRRFIRGVPILAGDHYHTHHRLLEKGFSKRQVVLILYAVTLLLAGAAYLSQIIPEGSGWTWLPGFIFAGTLIGIAWWAGYLRREAIGRIFHRRRRNTVLAAFSRYAIRSLTSKSAFISPFEILSLCRRELRLCFLEAWFENGHILIGSSGRPPRDRPGEEQFDHIERLRIKSVSGLSIIVRYQFSHDPDDSEFQDTAACLAGIFEQAGVNLLLKKAVSLQGEIEDRTILDGIEREMYC